MRRYVLQNRSAKTVILEGHRYRPADPAGNGGGTRIVEEDDIYRPPYNYRLQDGSFSVTPVDETATVRNLPVVERSVTLERDGGTVKPELLSEPVVVQPPAITTDPVVVEPPMITQSELVVSAPVEAAPVVVPSSDPSDPSDPTGTGSVPRPSREAISALTVAQARDELQRLRIDTPAMPGRRKLIEMLMTHYYGGESATGNNADE